MKIKMFISLTLILTLLSGIVLAGNFTDNGNGTVTDSDTGLMWQQGGDSKTWESALTYCEGLSLAGYNDWRLPNIKEIKSIVDNTRYSPAMNTTYFSNTSSYYNYYWSSTTHRGYAASGYAWYVDFNDGSVLSSYKSGGYHVRCVRGGQ